MQVLGVSLDEDEQLFYAYEIDMKRKRLIGTLLGVGLILLGFLTMCFMWISFLLVPLGGWVIFKTVKPSKDNIVAILLTSKRMVALPFDDTAPPDEVTLEEIEDVKCKRKFQRGGGLSKIAVNFAKDAIANRQQNKLAKTHPNYWSNATEVHLVLTDDRLKKWNIDGDEGPNLGPLIAMGLARSWDWLIPIDEAPSTRTVSLL